KNTRMLKSGDKVDSEEFIRTAAGSHATVKLLDGSDVEMNQRSAFAVSATRRDTTIQLDQGGIIVHAAKRRRGHLYVSAPDCRVAVTGTMFAINAGTKRSEEHTSELQSRFDLVCRLLLEKKNDDSP